MPAVNNKPLPPARAKRPAMQAGDIGCVFASTLAPFYSILVDGRKSVASQATSLAFSQLQDDEYAGKFRPCVIFDYDPFYPRVCLMATFHGVEHSKLPEFYKHFCVPVFPTAETEETLPLVKIEPCWETRTVRNGTRKPAWIIARHFIPKRCRAVTKRWKTDGNTFRMDEDELGRLDDIVREQNRLWRTKSVEDRKADEFEFACHVAKLAGVPVETIYDSSGYQGHTTKAELADRHTLCDAPSPNLPVPLQTSKSVSTPTFKEQKQAPGLDETKTKHEAGPRVASKAPSFITRSPILETRPMAQSSVTAAAKSQQGSRPPPRMVESPVSLPQAKKAVDVAQGKQCAAITCKVDDLPEMSQKKAQAPLVPETSSGPAFSAVPAMKKVSKIAQAGHQGLRMMTKRRKRPSSLRSH